MTGIFSETEDGAEVTRDEEMDETEPTAAETSGGKSVPRREQLVAIIGFDGSTLVRRVIDGNPIEQFRVPTEEEKAILSERGQLVKTMNRTATESLGLGAVMGPQPVQRPFYKHPVVLGVAAVAAVGLGYYAYQKLPDWLDAVSGTRVNGDDDELDDDLDDEE